ncbi:MAG TPA: TIM barrel protein [Planctomycetota bacterium]|nr:TIM barrel protein [Planctomycetota bacterium]
MTTKGAVQESGNAVKPGAVLKREGTMELQANVKSVVHFMLYTGPGNTDSVLRSEPDESYLLSSIQKILDDPYFGNIEITHIKNSKLRKKVAEAIKKSKKEATFGCQPVQIINEEQIIEASDISSIDENERRKALTRILELLEEAAELGCNRFALYSGVDPAQIGGPHTESRQAQLREMGKRQLVQSLDEICKAAAKKNIQVLLEPFDRRGNASGEKAFKTCLIGPTPEAIQVAEYVRRDMGNANFALMLDLCHHVIMGECSNAIRQAAPYIGFFHVANTVLNRNNPGGLPRYGDAHPKFGVPDSEVTAEVLEEFIKALVEVGYSGPIGFEVKPIGSETPEDVLSHTKVTFDSARNTIDVAFVRRNNYCFRSHAYFTEEVFEEIARLRVEEPDLIKKELTSRKRRKTIAPTGYLTVLAADHPARYIVNPTEMGSRLDYAGRIVRCLAETDIDGLMATADVIEDIVLANYIFKQRNKGKSFLDDKILMACVNRTGLSGLEHELMDRESAYMSAKKIKEMNLDAAKMLLRIPAKADKTDRFAVETMERCAKVTAECVDLQIPMFMEPLAVERKPEGGYHVLETPDALIKVMGVAAGLAHSSAYTWLKIPYCPQYDRVVKASTLPVLMLGGPSTGRPAGTLENFVRGMGAGPNVRGALVGRNVIFPGDDDPAVIAQAIHLIVQERLTALEAISRVKDLRGANMDRWK